MLHFVKKKKQKQPSLIIYEKEQRDHKIDKEKKEGFPFVVTVST